MTGIPQCINSPATVVCDYVFDVTKGKSKDYYIHPTCHEEKELNRPIDYYSKVTE